MSRLSHYLQRVEETIVAVSLGGATLIIVVSVVMRYVLHNALSWAEEGAILLLVFSTFVGASLALRHREHVGIDILSTLVGPRGRKGLLILSAVLTACYCAALGGLGWVMATSDSAVNAVTPALQLPVWAVQLALPLGLTLMFLRALELLVLATRRAAAGPPEGDADVDGATR